MDKQTEDVIKHEILIAFRGLFQTALKIGETPLQNEYKDMLSDKISEDRADELYIKITGFLGHRPEGTLEALFSYDDKNEIDNDKYKCAHETVLAIYTDSSHRNVNHYRCPDCGKIDEKQFGRTVVYDYPIKIKKVKKC